MANKTALCSLAVLSLLSFSNATLASDNISLKPSSYPNILKSGVPKSVLKKSLEAYQWGETKTSIHKPILTIVDFALPSSKKRMWTVNLKTDSVIFHGLVAQGKNTGLNYAHHFSNRHGSDESSLGVYLTSNTYYGHHGRSLRVRGLENGLNSNAESRAIVVHSAWYATPRFDKEHGRLGRSWGCFALNPKYAEHVISTIKSDTILFAYSPQLNNDPHYPS